MSFGNWYDVAFRRSRGSRRRRVLLTIASLVALAVLVALATSFFRTPDAMPGGVWLIAGLLIIGILWGLRPWAR